MINAEYWKAFDLADWCLDLMISHCAQLIHAEKQKAAPDQALLMQWLQVQGRLDDERDDLRIDDLTNSERVYRTYGPLLESLKRSQNTQ